MTMATVRTGTLGVWALAVLPALASGQSRCEHRDVVELSARAAQELRISAGSGSLDVRGEAAVTDVEVTATLCASDEERLEALDVRLEPDGSVVYLETDYPDWRSGRGTNYARIDLQVVVPAGTDLDVEDGSGSMSLTGVGHVTVEDGSGSMSLIDVGRVTVDDGSGGIFIRGAASVDLTDGSGEVEIVEASGDVRVDDGSGPLDIRGVGGDVYLSDGSGGIDVEEVVGSVRVEEMGSGALSVHDVGGDLVVEDGRRSRIRYSDVRGELDLPPARRRGGRR